jgi:orotidine-5'-phosphate decarboxylase
LFEKIAQKAIEWNKQGNVGLVVGATQAENMKQVRRIAPNLPFLIPGVGAQGGDLETAVAAGRDDEGAGMVIPLSRTILYKSSDTDFASRSREAALDIRDKINRLL